MTKRLLARPGAAVAADTPALFMHGACVRALRPLQAPPLPI